MHLIYISLILLSCLDPSSDPFLSSYLHARNHMLAQLKSFIAVKMAWLIPESIFSNTHIRYAHVHAWHTNNHYFCLLCWFSSSRLNGLLPCVVRLKMEHGMSACMTQPLPLLNTGQCDTSMSLIQGDFKLYCHVCLLYTYADMLFLSYKTKLQNCGRLQNALEWRVPTMPHPLSLTKPGEKTWGPCQPDN